MAGFSIEVDGKVYKKWGFAVVILNWKALVDRSGLYETFEREGMQFQLTRTDTVVDSEMPSGYLEEVAVLAESPNYEAMKPGHNSISTDLETTNNLWNLS